jgi:hypothetical protein
LKQFECIAFGSLSFGYLVNDYDNASKAR